MHLKITKKMNNEEEIFINQLQIFAHIDEANLYLEMCNDILKQYKLSLETECIKFAALETGETLGLALIIGNRKIIGIKRTKNTLIIGLILPNFNQTEYEINPSFIEIFPFSKGKSTENEPILVYFDFLKLIKTSFFERIKNDFYDCIETEINKNYKANNKQKQNYFFWKACAEEIYRAEILKNITPEKIKEYTERDIENEEDDDDYGYSFDSSKIDITTEQRSLDSIINRLKYDGIDMNTDFQRSENLWSDKNMGRLIESILLKLPLPAFYFDASNDENWLVVDGLQRLSTLQKFVIYADKNHPKHQERLILKDLKILKDISGDYNQLSGLYKRRISEMQITAYLIKPATPIEVKYTIFHRINTGGLRLNAQEIRNSLNQKEKNGIEFLKKLSQISMFKNLVRITDKRMQDKEIILRFLAFQTMEMQEYNGSLGVFLDKTLEKLNEISAEYPNLENKFINALDINQKIFGEKSFSININENEKSMFNRALYDVMMYYFAQIPTENKENFINKKENIKQDFGNILNDIDFKSSITSATGGITKVNIRFEKIYTILKKYYNQLTIWKNDKNA